MAASEIHLKEIRTVSYALGQLQPFCLQSSTNGSIAIMSRPNIQIMTPQLKYSPVMNVFGLKPHIVQCPKSMPTNDLDTNEVEIYNSANAMKKQDLLLDLRYMPKLSNISSEQLIHSRAIAWSPPDAKGKSMIAYLSNYGGLEIFVVEEKDCSWKCILNVGNYWMQELIKEKEFPLKKCSELESLVDEILMTCISFDQNSSSDGSYRLICMTKSNKCLVFQLKPNETEKNFNLFIQKINEIPQKHVTCVKWIEISPSKKKNQTTSFIAGSLEGKIYMYKIDSFGKIFPSTILWEDDDQLATSGIEVTELSDGFLVVVVKGGHFLAFHLNSDFVLKGQEYEMVSAYPITGLFQVSATEYMVSILNTEIKKVSITIGQNPTPKLTIHPITLSFNLQGSSFYGFCSSPNQAYFVLASYVTQGFDHLVLRQPVNFTVCRLSDVNPFKRLMELEAKSFVKVQDLIEVVRFLAAKDIKIIYEYEKMLDLTANVGFHQEFLYKCKLGLVLASTRYTYFRLRSEAETEISSKRIERIGQILEVIKSYEILKQLVQAIVKSGKNPSDFQKISMKCLRLSILNYIEAAPVTEDLARIHQVLSPVLTELILETPYLDVYPNEICTFCDLEVLGDTKMMCKEKHKTDRCCITKVQTALFNGRECSQCGRCSVESLENLKEIVLEGDSYLKCPLCDINLEEIV